MRLRWCLLVGLGVGCQPRPAAVTVSPDDVRVENGPIVLQAAVVDTHGNPLADIGVTWTTSDPSIVTVETGGRLTPVHSGEATVRAAVGELGADALVEVDRFGSATLEVPALLSAGERAPVGWSALDDAGGPWEGAVACSSSDESVLRVTGRDLTAVAPGQVTVTCAAAGTTLTGDARVLPSEWDGFAWTRATSVRVADHDFVPFSRDEVPSDDWLRLSDVLSWRTGTGRPAYVVLAELLDLTVAYSCQRGQAIVLTPGGSGLEVQARVDLGSRCVRIPICAGCDTQRSSTLAPPRFTATGLAGGGRVYAWQSERLVGKP